jgi:ribonucleotide reductase alpha subunit
MQLQHQLSQHALAVLEKRFLQRDQNGQLVEDPQRLFRRVAKAIAAVDDIYHDFKREESEETFFGLMASLKFLPNSPTLMNAGLSRGQLSGCFVLPVEDSMESIYGTLRDAALIQKSGGGTGFSFSSCARAAITFVPRVVFRADLFPSCASTTIPPRSIAWVERELVRIWPCSGTIIPTFTSL